MRSAVRSGRRGVTIIEALVSAAIVAITVAFSIGMYRYQMKYQRGAIAANAASGVDEELANRITGALKGMYFAGSCDAAALRAAVEAAAPSGITLRALDNPAAFPDDKIGPWAKIARDRCPGSSFLSGVTGGADLYFCLAITAAPGSRVPPSSAVAMQPFFGEFRFRVTNLKNGSPIPCSAFNSVSMRSGFLHYNYHWSAPDKLFKHYAGIYSKAVLMP